MKALAKDWTHRDWRDAPLLRLAINFFKLAEDSLQMDIVWLVLQECLEKILQLQVPHG